MRNLEREFETSLEFEVSILTFFFRQTNESYVVCTDDLEQTNYSKA